MKLCLSILFAVVVLGYPLSNAQDRRAAVELVRERAPQEDRLIAINRTLYPVSAGVRLSALENATVLDASDVERTVAPSSELLLARVVRLEAGSAWGYEHEFHWYPGAMETKHTTNHIYTLPYAEGQAHRVLQGFNGEFSHGNRFAIDWAMPIGTRVMAARGGTVILVVVKHPEGGEDPAYLGMANRIWILHDDGTIGVYAHIVAHSAQVAPGQRVKAGQRLALSGNSGFSSRPHLHFEVQAGATNNRPRSFPIAFRTARAAVAVPIADVSYMRPTGSGSTPRIPTNVIRGLQFFKRETLGQQEVHTDSFDSDDQMVIRFGIGAPDRYKLRVDFYRSDSQRRRFVRTRHTRHDQEQAEVFVDLGTLREPSGSWTARVMFEELVLAERSFVVGSEN